MKVFMSWSGDRSREVAQLLDYWIKCVVQASRPWISTSGIDAGSIWFNQINNELQDTTFGIICLTDENKTAPWILFEAGALAKGLATSRVCTFLVDLETGDVRDPLGQFNHTLPTQESMWKLVSTLNGSLPDAHRLDTATLKSVFDTFWPQFDTRFKQILHDFKPKTVTPPREDKDILVEILESVRGLSKRVRSLEVTAHPSAHGRELSPAAAWKAGFAPSKVFLDPLNKAILADIAHKHLLEGKSANETESILFNMPYVTPEVASEAMQAALNKIFTEGAPQRGEG